jgi:hypothetical protein
MAARISFNDGLSIMDCMVEKHLRSWGTVGPTVRDVSFPPNPSFHRQQNSLGPGSLESWAQDWGGLARLK